VYTRPTVPALGAKESGNSRAPARGLPLYADEVRVTGDDERDSRKNRAVRTTCAVIKLGRSRAVYKYYYRTTTVGRHNTTTGCARGMLARLQRRRRRRCGPCRSYVRGCLFDAAAARAPFRRNSRAAPSPRSRRGGGVQAHAHRYATGPMAVRRGRGPWPAASGASACFGRPVGRRGGGGGGW